MSGHRSALVHAFQVREAGPAATATECGLALTLVRDSKARVPDDRVLGTIAEFEAAAVNAGPRSGGRDYG